MNLLSSYGDKIQKYPIKYLLDDNRVINNYNKTVLTQYSDNLNLNKSIIFIPNKLINETNSSDILKYEPYYKTKYSYNKLNFTNIKKVNLNETNNIKFIPEKVIDDILNNINICDSKCINNINNYSKNEVIQLNKTSKYEYWYKYAMTLDLGKASLEIQFNFDKFTSDEEKINIIILETYFRRKLKRLNAKAKHITNSISVSRNSDGIKINIIGFNNSLAQNINEVSDKIIKFLFKSEPNDFESVKSEVKANLNKQINSQPHNLGYEYLQKNIFSSYITSEEYLIYLNNYLNLENFKKFLKVFNSNYYLKILLIGDINENLTGNILTNIGQLVKYDKNNYIKNLNWSIYDQSVKNNLKRLKGNFLIRTIYPLDANKNNLLLKAYKIGKVNYKSEIFINLFNTIIGNIVFRELRINKQFGYIAKSKIEIFDSYYVNIY